MSGLGCSIMVSPALAQEGADDPLAQRETVTHKVWDPGTPIGESVGRDANGMVTTTYNGRMTAPQDQRPSTPTPATVVAAPDGTLSCAVEVATDDEHWVEGETSGTAGDEVLSPDGYTWSGGQFVVGTNPDGTHRTASTVKGPTATWLAPHEPGSYSITCTVDDRPTPIEPNQSGSRDDPAVARTVAVTVAAATAQLKIYQVTHRATDTQPEQTAEVTSATKPIGGKCYAVLELEIGHGLHIASTVDNATLRIEEDSSLHTDAEKRLDRDIDFTSSAGWEKYYDPDGDAGEQPLDWYPSPESPRSAATVDGTAHYRAKLLWQTTTQPLGHNEIHTVSIARVNHTDGNQLTFESGAGGGTVTSTPTNKGANVKNLVITEAKVEVGTDASTDAPLYHLDYLKFDPESTEPLRRNPRITFTTRGPR